MSRLNLSICSSVVTSVFVIMEAGNGSKIYADAVGKPVSKPQMPGDVASPIDLLNPDRYEFYTFDDTGDLVKRLMTLEEIHDIIATGDGDGFPLDDAFTSDGFVPEKRVNDVVNNVQNVLKEEIKMHKNPEMPLMDTPDVSDSWSMILPAVFGNSGEDIKPEPPITHVTPDTIMVEPTLKVTATPTQISTTEKVMTLQTKKTKPTKTTTTTEKMPTINVEIITNSNSTTEKAVDSLGTGSSQVVEIRPFNDFEATKENAKPVFHHGHRRTTKRPFPVKVSTFRPTLQTSTTLQTSKTSTTQRIASTETTSTTPRTTTTRASSTTPQTTSTAPPTTSTTPPTTSTTSQTTSTTAQTTSTTPPTTSTTPQTTSTTPQTTSTRPRTTSTTPQTTSTTPQTTSTTPQTTSTTPQTTSTTRASSTTPQTTSTTQATTSFELDQVLNDAPEEAASELLEKIVLSQSLTAQTTEILTTTGITTELPTTERMAPTTERIASSVVTTEVPETTSTEVPSTTVMEESKSTQVPDRTTTPADITSTYGALSTFFTVESNKVTPETISSDSTDDLSTLNTEYITVKTITNNRVANGTEISTTESESTDRTTSNFLDQLLLTSTNIYEINSELSEVAESTDGVEDSTSAEDRTTEKFFVKLTNPTEAPPTTTTDQTFIETIEQLLSQAVGTPAPPIESEKEATIIQEMIINSVNKTMPQVMMESATLASNLVGINEEVSTVPTSTFDDTDLLRDSVGSLLSQVYGQGSTTVEYDTTTAEVTTTVVPVTTTVPTTTTTTTTIPTTTTTTVPTTTAVPTTTTAVPTTTPTSTTPARTTTMTPTTLSPSTTTQNFVPHIINITIIRNENRTKPAKSDLSLEVDYQDLIKEIEKNSTLASMIPSQEVLKAEASSSVQDQTSTESPTTVTTSDEVTTTDATTTSPAPPPDPKPSIVITINENNKTDPEGSTWMLVPTVAPHGESNYDPVTEQAPTHHVVDPAAPVDLIPKPLQGFGLEDSTAKLDTDIYQFVQLCNELAFGFWKSVTTGISSARSVVVSPFAATSLLAMVFLGARGATSGEMNEILKLDDMVTFNPHLIFKNVTESIEVNPDSGVAISAIVRELYSDRSKGKLLGFYKERVRQFYDGHVEEASFREIGDVIRRRTNLLVKKNTDGKISEYLKDGSIVPKPPLAGVSVSIFQTDCSQGSTEGRDGELHFVVLPSIRQRRLVPIPATVYRSGFLAGYEPSLDATAAALGTKDQTISTIFIIPGQQGVSAPGDGLARLEKRLVESSFRKGAWSRLLRSLIPRPGLELQIPRFQHRSLINATQSLKRMGLHDLFDSRKADLKGLNGAAHELHLSDVLQINEFATCGERRIGEAHHREVYPATVERKSRLLEGDWDEPRDYQRAFHDPLHDPSYLSLPLSQRPRQARLPEAPRLRFDRPFLYVIRHNPSGLILHMGRFHPRLLP